LKIFREHAAHLNVIIDHKDAFHKVLLLWGWIIL
jgi:hypothetical protein